MKNKKEEGMKELDERGKGRKNWKKKKRILHLMKEEEGKRTKERR